ncbi:heavy metal translocating P-type ATPase [bacterium]|nr:heavy metal translocating P-type ATPase [bacterium]
MRFNARHVYYIHENNTRKERFAYHYKKIKAMNAEDHTEKTRENCILTDLAYALLEDARVKAIWIDTAHRKVFFAFEEGISANEPQKHLEDIVSRHSYQKSGHCSFSDSHWQKVCRQCEGSAKDFILPGVRVLRVPDAGILLEKQAAPPAGGILNWRTIKWIKLKPRQIPHVKDIVSWKKETVLAALCGIATLCGVLLEKYLPENRHYYSHCVYLFGYICGAWYPAGMVLNLLKKRILDIHFLMIAVAAGAATIGYWAEGAILLFLFSLSSAIEELVLARTEREIHSLFTQAPKSATVITADKTEEEIPVDSLAPDMVIRVRPGEQFPVDAEIIAGITAANESNITGESLPVDKQAGDKVFSGTLNMWGSVDCRVLKKAGESVLSKIITLIRKAQESKAPAQRFTDKFGTGYTYVLLGVCVAMFFVWWGWYGFPAFFAPAGMRSAFYRTMTLLVVGSPCALVLSIPSAILAGIAAAARNGVLFRGGIAIENLAEIGRVALDKTGTLTTGELHVLAVESYPKGNEDAVFKIAASVSYHSTHPVARAIIRSYMKKETATFAVDSFRSIDGMGIVGKITLDGGNEAQDVRVGRRKMITGAPWLADIPLPPVGITETIVEAGAVRGRVLLKDQVRTDSAPLLEQLSRQGLRVTMLTGDRAEAARMVAEQIGVTEVFTELNPEQKRDVILQWKQQGEKVAMIGDGVNDAPCLSAAYVGVGMGVRGSDAVLEQADIVLMLDRLENFIYAYEISKKARRIIRQNLTVSLGILSVLVISSVFGEIPLTLGVIGHESSTLLVVLNSLRLLFFNPAIGKDKK